jgi:hemerythrin-like domain-containing protein
MDITSSLLKDHETILEAVKNLELRVGDWRRAGRITNPESLQKFIEFTKLFTDRCHHGKEEKCLFPCLVRLGIPEEGGPIGVMLAEHKLMRGLISQLERSFNHYLSTGSGLENVLSLCMDYIFQLRQHVDKENGILFPMGENISGEDDKKRTNECYEYVEEIEVGHALHDKLSRIAKEI